MAISHPGSWKIFGKSLPDFGLTERAQNVFGFLGNGQRTAQGGSNIIGGASQSHATPTSYGQVLSASASNPVATTQYSSPIGPQLPRTSGQASSGGGQVLGTSTGDTSTSSGPSYQDQLRQAYDYARSIYESQMPGLEQDYTRTRGDVEAAVGRAKETLGQQIGDINLGYGEGLRNLLTSDRELGQKQRNVYAGLNALDSSSFAEAENKRGQQLFDTQSKLESEKQRNVTEANKQYSDYERQATGILADLGNQYMSARDSLRMAVASNNIEEANAIQNYMQQIQSTVSNLKLNLASLQAQGTDVVGGLKQLNRGGIDSIIGGYLGNYYNPALQGLSSSAPTQMAGQGYISPRTGRKYNSYQDYLRSEGA